MKRYESASSTVVTPRTPVVVRVDGRSFSRYTAPLRKSGFASLEFRTVMAEVGLAMANQCSDVECAFIQSDEISLLFHFYKDFESLPWFGGKIQKIASVTAGIASSEFTARSPQMFSGEMRPAHFDSRVFVLPEAEVENYFISRFRDCTRNSVQMMAQFNFSHKELQGKSITEQQEMLRNAGRPWEALDAYQKYGTMIVKDADTREWVSHAAGPIMNDPPTRNALFQRLLATT